MSKIVQNTINGLWNSSSELFSIDVSCMPMGTYDYTLLASDVGVNSVSDSVLVTITDETLPIFNNPTDVSISYDIVNKTITWSLTEINPDVYELFIEGTLARVGLWNSSLETLTISVDGLQLGIYNYTVIVFDISNNNASSTIWLTVIDDTSPIIDTPLDIHYDYVASGNSIIWDVYDQYLVGYDVYDCGELWSSGVLSIETTSLEIDVCGLPVGSHNFTLVVFDTSGNSVSDSIWVSVLPTGTSPIDEPDVTDEPTNSGDPTGVVPNEPMQFAPTISEEIIAIFTGWLIGGVAVLSVFLIFSRPKK